MDLSMMSVDDLRALKAGDIGKLSRDALLILRGQGAAVDANRRFAEAAKGSPELTRQGGQMAADASTGIERFSAGAGKAVADIGLGIRGLVGATGPGEVKETRARDAALMNSGAGLAGNVAGNIAAVMVPGGAVRGAGMLASKAPAIAGYAPALEAIGAGLVNPQTIKGAAALGGALGVVQPADSVGERVNNTGIGMLASAALPAAVAGVRGVRTALEPFSDAGQRQIVGRALRRAAGPYADDVIARLDAASPLVPGSQPTVGQAARNPGMAALERTATAIDPIAGAEMARRTTAQNAARLAALEELAGTAGRREFFAASRDATADALYELARKADIDPAKLTAGRKAEITKLLQTPAIKSAIREARIKAQNEMKNVTDPKGSVLGLDYLKRSLDDQIAKASPDDRRILTGLKQRLLKTLDDLSPEYAEARRTFSEMSKPITQMDVAQAIYDASLDPMRGTLRPAAFARALNDKTAAKATGMRNATLESVLDPDQLGMLNAIRRDLRRSDYAMTAGRGSGSDTVQKLAYSNMLEAAGVPTWMRLIPGVESAAGIGGRIADALYGTKNQQIIGLLANSMLDPKQAASLMRQATPAAAPSPALLAARRAAITPLLATPGILNAVKE